MPVPDDIGPAARRLVAALGLDGYSEVEFRRDAAGIPALMEINPRPTASLESAVRVGDVRWLDESLLHPTAPDALSRGRTIGRFASDFVRRGGYDCVDRHDLEPTVVASWASVVGGARRVRRYLTRRR